MSDLYLAHLALSDLDGKQFYHLERSNRAGPGIAGVSESSSRIWNGNWQVILKNENQQLQAVAGEFQLNLSLHSEKTPVIHGQNGVSQKAPGPGRASHYISLTRLVTSGSVTLSGKISQVNGLSWMDHEFFTHQLPAEQAGWDWLSLQLDDHTELMLFRIRRKDGSLDPFSSGTFIDVSGKTKHLASSDFTLLPQSEKWTSPETHAAYPIHWKIVIPSLNIYLDASTLLPSQELSSISPLSPKYWEGAIVLTGIQNSHPIRGTGYLEMTGYDRPIDFAP